MPSSANVALQVGAVVLAISMRLTESGWLFFAFVLGAGPAFLAGQVLLAVCAARRPVISPGLARPFVGAAVSLVVANALISDYGDDSRYPAPLEVLTGPLPEWTQTAGLLLLPVWVCCLFGALIVFSVQSAAGQVMVEPGWPRLSAVARGETDRQRP